VGASLSHEESRLLEAELRNEGRRSIMGLHVRAQPDPFKDTNFLRSQAIKTTEYITADCMHLNLLENDVIRASPKD
jgi:hypothetical protein